MVTIQQPASPVASTSQGAATADAAEQAATPSRLARLGAALGVLLLALAYILPGLIGRDPWGPDEALSIGIVHNMVTTGDLVVPSVAGQAILDDPPGYYIGAAKAAELLRPWLPLHDGARVATGVCVALALVFVGLMARRGWGPGAGAAAVLALVGSLALLQYGHVLVPDMGLLAAMAVGCHGLLRARESAAWGGLWLGTGFGLAFLSKDLFGPGVLGLAALLLPVFSDWRSRVYPRALAIALVVAMPWLLVWPAELYLRDPALFWTWLLANSQAVAAALVVLQPPTQGAFWLRTLPWASFPVLLLALWTLLSHPVTALRNPAVRVALAVSLIGLGLLLWSSDPRDLHALPLLVPLAVMAAGGIRDLPGWLVRLGYWLSVVLFAATAAALWALWGYGIAQGQPPQWPSIGAYLPLDFHPTLDRDAALLAAALTLVWLLVVQRLRPPRPSALAAWPLGITLALVLASLLHRAWLDSAESDRALFMELKAQLPVELLAQHSAQPAPQLSPQHSPRLSPRLSPGTACLAVPDPVDLAAGLEDWRAMALGPVELGLLAYFTGIKPVMAPSPREAPCDWVLVRVARDRPKDQASLGQGWERVWQGTRPIGGEDGFALFRWREDLLPAGYFGMPPARRSGLPQGQVSGPDVPDPTGEAAPAPRAPEPPPEATPHG